MTIRNRSVAAGANAGLAICSVPPSAAAPPTASTSNAPGAVPSISARRIPPAPWAKLPATLSVPGDAPGSTVPPLFVSDRTVPRPFSVPPFRTTSLSSVVPDRTSVRPAVCVSVPKLPLGTSGAEAPHGDLDRARVLDVGRAEERAGAGLRDRAGVLQRPRAGQDRHAGRAVGQRDRAGVLPRPVEIDATQTPIDGAGGAQDAPPDDGARRRGDLHQQWAVEDGSAAAEPGREQE